MSTGKYTCDNFVRVDCGLPATEFAVNAIHEVAHFTLAKNTSYGLLCFFLGQDILDARSRMEQTMNRLEQAFECVNECYARTMELFLSKEFLAASPQRREELLDLQRQQPYYFRYHMEQIEPLLLNCPQAAKAPVFPHFLFFIAADIDLSPFYKKSFQRGGDPTSAFRASPRR